MTIGAIALAMAMTAAMPARSEAALPAPCPAALKAGDGPILTFCRDLARRTLVADVRYRRHYRPAQVRAITRVFALEAKRADVIIEVSSPVSGTFAWRGPGYEQVVNFDFSGIKKFAGKAFTVAKRVVGGAMKIIPQARMINCGLLATLAAAGSALKGDQVGTVLGAAGLACLGAFLPLRPIP